MDSSIQQSQENSPLSEPVWPDAVQTYFNRLMSRRGKQIYLTASFKLHLKSRWKENELLWMQVQATNMTSAILKAVEESPFQPRDDGALALITDMLTQGSGFKNARHLLNILSATYSKRLGFTTKEFPIPGVVRTAVFGKCAEILLAWYMKFISVLGMNIERQWVTVDSPNDDDTPTRRFVYGVPSVTDVYQAWAKMETELKDAEKEEVPFGRHRGIPFGEVGMQRRELRWLLKRLIPKEDITTTLKAVEILLTPDPDNVAATHAAKRVFHPWRLAPRNVPTSRRRASTQRGIRQRSARVSYIDQRIPDTAGQRIRLGLLHKNELWRLRDELQEQLQFVDQFTKIRGSVETLLKPRVPHMPYVSAIPSLEEWRKRERDYVLALHRFDKPIGDKDTTPEQLLKRERATTNNLLQRSSDLIRPPLQPIGFTRTGRPSIDKTSTSGRISGYGSFALLYDRRTGDYSLYIPVPGKYLPKDWHFKNDGHLYFFNFPESPFAPSSNKKVVVCSLEYGDEYHDNRLLHTILERQREAQHRTWMMRSGTENSPIEQCLPPGDAPVSAAEITSVVNVHGHLEFYAHLSVPVDVPACLVVPESVIGIHEHEEGYSYAILKSNGEVCCGDLIIPKWVDPYEGARPSDNYAFEVAVALVKLSKQYNGYIGLENTWWKKKAPSLNRNENRVVFARPSRKIADILQYKAELSGLLKPHFTWGRSAKECGHCGHGHDKTVSLASKDWPIIQYQPLTMCPMCSTKTLQKEDANMRQQCTTCERSWPISERMFTCRQCGTSRPERYNSALVVARYTLEQLEGKDQNSENVVSEETIF